MIFPGRDTIVVLGLAALIAVLWYVDHARLTAKYASDMLAMRDAGLKALNNRLELVSSLKEKNRANADRIDRLSAGNRVHCYSEPRVPASGNVPDTDPKTDDRGARDTTAILRQCLKTFYEVTGVIEAK